VASAGGIRAGRAYVELTADDSKLAAGLRSAQRKLQAFGSSVRNIGTQVAAAGAAILAPLALMTKRFAETGDALTEMAQRTGVPVQTLSELGYAAGLSGSSLEDVEASVRILQKRLGDLGADAPAAIEALAALGLKADDLAAAGPAGAVQAVAAALAGIADPGKRAALAVSVLGSAGAQLAPIAGDAKRLGAALAAVGAPSTGRAAAAPGSPQPTAVTAPDAGALTTAQGALVGLTRTLSSVLGASDQTRAAFDGLGLSADRLKALTPEQQFLAVAAALRRIPDPTARAAAAMAVLGKSGTKLLPVIQDLDALRSEARRLGASMTAGQAEAAGALADAWDRVTSTVGGLATAIGSALAPVLLRVAQAVTTFMVGLREWIDRNQGLVVGLLGLGTVLGGVGLGLVALGITASAVGTGLGVLASIASAASAVFVFLGGVLGSLLTPMAAVIAGVVALGVVIVTQTQTGQQALGMLSAGFQTLEGDAVAAWGGIADALAAGDIGLAAKIVWTTLKLEWERGTSFLLNFWDAAIAGFAKIFATTWFGIQEVFWTVVNSIADAWDSVIGGITKLWNNAVGAIASKLASLLELLGMADQGLTLTVEQQTTSDNHAVDDRHAQRSQARDQSVASLEADRQSVLQGITQDLTDKLTERDGGVDKARAELDSALAEARQQRTKVNDRMSGKGEANSPTPDASATELPDLSALTDQLARMPETLDVAAQKLDVTGSFNSAAIGQLGVGDSAGERTAKASEETAKNTQKLLRAAEDGQQVFG
jgi:hypothetical protein